MHKKNIRILLVEDNEGDILLLQEAFEEAKIMIDMSVVNNGQAALDFLHNQHPYETVPAPDLVLLDVNLPILNGHEVLHHIKTHAVLKTTAVIMLTTSSSPQDIDNAYANHVNSYITKPVGDNGFLKNVSGIEKFWINVASLPNHK